MRFLLLTTLLACVLLGALPPSAAADTGWAWPVQGEVITSYRNGADPYAGGQHRGIDIAAAQGEPVSAAVAGTVTFAGTAGTSGLAVNIRTDAGRFDASYLHLASAEVRKGDRVAAGDRIGAVGTSGRRSAQQPHLHFGVREAGSRHGYVDPLDLLPPATPPSPEPPPPPLPVPVAVLPFLEPAAAPAPAAAAVPGAVPSPALAPLPALRAAPRTEPYGRTLAEPPRAQPQASSPGNRLNQGHGPLKRRETPQGPATRSEQRGLTASPAREATPGPPTKPAIAGGRFELDRSRPNRGGRGIDVAWLAACLGLVVVSLTLGRPAGPAAAARRARATVSAIARPLAGRH
jgi:Peptidase family M23